jgi:hypothetical protein
MVSFFDRAGSLARGLRRKPAAKRHRDQDRRLRLAIDQLESRVALAITTPLSIGGSLPVVTVGSFTDAPTGPGDIGDYVTVSIEGTRGTVIFNDGVGVPNGGTITRIDIVDASPDFQVTFNGVVRTSGTGTPAVIPYGSDGIIQLGQIFTTNVIRGINTVKGPLTNTAPTSGTLPLAVGFTQTGGGSTLTLAGDWTSTFPVDTFVCATPEVVSSGSIGSPVFATIVGTPTFSGGFTTITLNASLPSNTTGGALTTAETVNPYFELTSFVGVNFSNLNLKQSGGLFVDRVVGGASEFGPDTGIVLTQGLLPYSSIGIRDQLDATVLLGTTRNAAVDGRVFIESTTAESVIVVGRQSRKTPKNSRFELQGGEGDFAGDVVFTSPFNQGIVNLGGDATGTFAFLRGVGAAAVLNADEWADVTVVGDFAGTINASSDDIILSATGNVAGTARINSNDDVALTVGGSVLKGATVAAGDVLLLDITRNLSGTLSAGTRSGAPVPASLLGSVGGDISGATMSSESEIALTVGGNVINSTISADNGLILSVARNVSGSRFHVSEDEGISMFVGGNFTNSAINASSDDDDSVDESLSLTVLGNLTGSTVQSEEDMTLDVRGNVAKSTFISTESDVLLDVTGSMRNSKLLAGQDVDLFVGGSALATTVLADDDVDIEVDGDWSGVAQSADEDVVIDVARSVLKGSSFTAADDMRVDVGGNFDGSLATNDLRFFVTGNVSKASRIVAQAVTDWQNGGGQNFRIGGRLDGVVNVVDFDGSPGEATVTLIDGGAGQSARFYVNRFATDSLVFNGNFRGNLRVLQDLVANLTFNGNVDRITVGGRVGTYTPGNTIGETFVNILVTGRLLFMNTNSLFQADVPGVSGTFWNVPNGLTPAATGQIVTGSYVQIVPTRPTTLAPPVGGLPQTYTVPDSPTSVTAAVYPDSGGNQIEITFAAPANDTLPILRTVYYQWSSDGGTNWSNFTDVLQQPGSPVLLPGTFVDGTYTIQVRAINAIGPSASASSNQVTISTGP